MPCPILSIMHIVNHSIRRSRIIAFNHGVCKNGHDEQCCCESIRDATVSMAPARTTLGGSQWELFGIPKLAMAEHYHTECHFQLLNAQKK